VTFLDSKGLLRCRRLREALVFARKLFDPFLYLTTDQFLLLDSDVLFYSHPVEVMKALQEGRPAFSVDNGYRYSLSEGELRTLLGKRCVEACNPGILVATKDLGRFELVEEWLAKDAFWKADGGAQYYAELTIWAMLLTLAEARPLSSAYGICSPYPQDPNVVSGHYCGGGYWSTLFYTRGLPYLAYSFLRASVYLKINEGQDLVT